MMKALLLLVAGTILSFAQSVGPVGQLPSAGASGGGTSIHHQYFMAAAANTGGAFPLFQINGASGASFLSNLPIGIGQTFASGGGGTAAVFQFLPSTWVASAGITLTVDVGPSNNNTGNYSLIPEYVCFPDGYDLGPAPSYMTGSPVSIAATAGTGTGFYRQHMTLTLSSPTCSPTNSIYLAITRPSGDSYTSTIFIYGIDVAITY